MTTFDYRPHPRIQQRVTTPPPQAADERIGFNGRLGAGITRAVGTMWAVYLAAVLMVAWMLLAQADVITFDPYPFAFLLFLGNIVQLLLMFVIMVGQQVLGAAADKRAVQTYRDAEAILHECEELQRHLVTQDQALDHIVSRMRSITAASGGQAGPATI